ncbi:DUF3987 domain-containing protein [Nitrosospira sp. Is2]|uniref:DUF3987 domain-containing protein n=1 Tax=Nitrosospira sp. Is2 TaxID=3080532 RepID=UPI002955942F|nr:DUF3987 domain-containing protein [Nitrosospira sp. Is2]WON75314.1 DUF3987 domain-containing protein [Nitrosospira sp. Is2]
MLAEGYLPQALHMYTDQDGNVLHWVIRLKHPNGAKWIRPMKLQGEEYILGEPDYSRGKPLYNLRDLAKRPLDPAIVAEGEWCVDALSKRGVLATTTGSADSVQKADLRPLAGRPVKIWADNDEAGQRYAIAMADALRQLDSVVQLVDVALLGLPIKGDAVDWLTAHPIATGADIHQLLTIEQHRASGSASETAKKQATWTPDSSSPDSSNCCKWDDPKPIQAPLPPVSPFDAQALLPGPLGNWVQDEAARMPCPADFIAGAAIVAQGSLIGARCAIKPKTKDSWCIVPNVWGGCVGLPSAKKTPALNAALKPLDLLIANAMRAHQARMDEFETDKAVFEAQGEVLEELLKTAAREAIKKSLADGKKAEAEDSEIAQTQDSGKKKLDDAAEKLKDHRKKIKTQAPLLRRYKTNDTTIEKLGEMLRENPAGLLVVRDELVGLLASWDRSGHEGDRAFYLEAWNGDSSFDTDRIGRGSIHIPNLCVSILGGIQPDKLTRYLEQAVDSLANDGMLQRFQILVYPDPQIWEWRDRAPNKDARDSVLAIFEALVDFDPLDFGAEPADDSVKFPHFCFDTEAQQIFIQFSNDLHRVKLPNEDQPIIAQHLAKFDKLFPAIALILHLVDCTATGNSGPVTADSARRAEAWCKYLEAHARRCYGLLIDDGLRSAQALAEKVRAGKLANGFTARDVRRNQWRYLTREETVQAALEWLEDECWLQSREIGGMGPGSGRHSWRYYINPKIGDSKNAGSVVQIDSPERDNRKSLKTGNQDTANTDDRSLTAVTAVPKPGKSGDSQSSNGSNGSTQSGSFRENGTKTDVMVLLTPSEEAQIVEFLEYIGETDPPGVADVLKQCRIDVEKRQYYLGQAAKALDGKASIK